MEKKKMHRMQIALSVVSALLILCIAVLSIVFYKLNSVNLFSKNIVLSNASFMNGTDTEAQAEELPNTLSEEDVPSADYASLYSVQKDLNMKQNELKNLIDGMQFQTILSVPHLQQGDALPNGCEAVCAATLLQYCGFSVTAEEFVDGYLPCEPVKLRWGCRYGPDPSKAYAGNPRQTRGGFGCFAPVIAEALRNCLPKEYIVADLTGKPLSELVITYIGVGIPIAVWVTQDMQPIEKAYQWQSYDKTETFLYPVNQHCMVLCGFDTEKYYFSDPLSDEPVVSYPRETVENCYRSMGMQAVAIFSTEKQ